MPFSKVHLKLSHPDTPASSTITWGNSTGSLAAVLPNFSIYPSLKLILKNQIAQLLLDNNLVFLKFYIKANQLFIWKNLSSYQSKLVLSSISCPLLVFSEFLTSWKNDDLHFKLFFQCKAIAFPKSTRRKTFWDKLFIFDDPILISDVFHDYFLGIFHHAHPLNIGGQYKKTNKIERRLYRSKIFYGDFILFSFS